MPSRPRRILALDGGGVRGTLTVAFLARLEALLTEAEGRPVRLADRFDLVGGTSTGAVIAGALALGHSAAEIRAFYLRLAPKVFRRSRLRVPGLQAVFDAAPLEREIGAVVGERTLESADLVTGLAIVMKRMDTGSAWVVTNNPRAPFWDDPADGSHIGNRHYKLRSLIRASTAAPHFFRPEPIQIHDGLPAGLFVDGGVTPYNNPALLLAIVATVPAYGWGWPAGTDALGIASIGTGAFRATLDPVRAARMTPAELAVRALTGLISDGQTQTLALLQWLGRTDTPTVINAEIGDLSTAPSPGAPLFSFWRYDVRLEPDALADLGFRLSPETIAGLRRMDNAAAIPLLWDIGTAAAERQVRPEHLAMFGAPAGG